MDVRTNFVREETLGLRCLTMILDTCVVEDVSIYLDTTTWELSATLEHPPFLGVSADTASAACLARSGTFANDIHHFCGRQMNRVQRIRRVSLHRLSQCHLGARHSLCNFDTTAVPAPHS